MDATLAQVIVDNREAALPETDPVFFCRNLSSAMRQLEQIIAHVASTNFPLLLVGESGVGKEAVASYIHRHSGHKDKPFTKIVCGALTPELFEKLRRGFDQKNGHATASGIGTLLLDEITDLAQACQASLLHAIPEGEASSLGRILCARIISTTSKTPEELEQAMDRSILRRDLFYRLNGVCLRLPPLRERKEDIPGLLDFLLRKHSLQLGCPQPAISMRTLQAIQEYSWPGNIRELENTVKRIVALGSESIVSDLGALPATSHPISDNFEKVSLKQAARAASRQVEKEMILKVLARTHWNRKRAAQHLQISYKALLNKLRQMGLDESGTL